MKRRGVNLGELVVYLGLGSLISLLLASQLMRVLKLSRRLESRDLRHKQAQVALQRLRQDLQQSRSEGISLCSAPVILGINRIQLAQDDGTLEWSPHFHLYYLEGDRLLRHTWPPGPPLPTGPETNTTLARLLSPARLQEIASPTSGGRREVLAREVVSFSLNPAERAVGLRLPLGIELKLGPAGQPAEQAGIEAAVMP